MIIAENLSSLYPMEQEPAIERGLQRMHQAVVEVLRTYMQTTTTETKTFSTTTNTGYYEPTWYRRLPMGVKMHATRCAS